MNLNRVSIACPDCDGKGFTHEDRFDIVCRLCFGRQTTVGYSEEQRNWLREQVCKGEVLQYDDSRDCCWIDLGTDHALAILERAHKYILRIKPDILDDTRLTCDITVGDRVVAKGSVMRQLQEAINAALSK